MSQTFVEQSLERCRSWVRHSGMTKEEMAERAGVSTFSLWRIKRGDRVGAATLNKVERSIPANFRDPLPSEEEAV